jgi:hypothetical protein
MKSTPSSSKRNPSDSCQSKPKPTKEYTLQPNQYINIFIAQKLVFILSLHPYIAAYLHHKVGGKCILP